jgi:hypothetical protein
MTESLIVTMNDAERCKLFVAPIARVPYQVHTCIHRHTPTRKCAEKLTLSLMDLLSYRQSVAIVILSGKAHRASGCGNQTIDSAQITLVVASVLERVSQSHDACSVRYVFRYFFDAQQQRPLAKSKLLPEPAYDYEECSSPFVYLSLSFERSVRILFLERVESHSKAVETKLDGYQRN